MVYNYLAKITFFFEKSFFAFFFVYEGNVKKNVIFAF